MVIHVKRMNIKSLIKRGKIKFMNIQEIDKAFEKLLFNLSISIFYFPYQDEKTNIWKCLN